MVVFSSVTKWLQKPSHHTYIESQKKGEHVSSFCPLFIMNSELLPKTLSSSIPEGFTGVSVAEIIWTSGSHVMVRYLER